MFGEGLGVEPQGMQALEVAYGHGRPSPLWGQSWGDITSDGGQSWKAKPSHTGKTRGVKPVRCSLLMLKCKENLIIIKVTTTHIYRLP
jgi:hypothetical protein